MQTVKRETSFQGSREVTWDFISERINDIIILADPQGMIVYASPAVRRFGYAPHELVGRMGRELVHPDDLEKYVTNTAGLFSGGAVDRGADREHRFRRADGSWVWLEGNPSLLPGPGGRPASVLNVFRDVAERRASREAMWEHARRTVMTEEVAGVGYWRLDAETLEAAWSEQMFRMHGLAVGDTIALETAKAQIHPEDRARSDALIAHALATGEGWQDTMTRVIHADGTLRHQRGRGVCETNAAGRVSALFGTVVDVTALVEAQHRLAESECHYRLMAENATDMISTTALDGRLTYLSPSVERVTGYKVGELLHGQMRDHEHPDDLKGFLRAFTELLADERAPAPLRFRAAHKDGHWMWLESNPRLVRDAAGRPVEIVDVTREVTEAQRLKDQLHIAVAEAERSAAAKGEFPANMSHEIRSPLTAVLGFASLLSERSDLADEARGQVARIAGASRALLAVVNDVLDFSKLEAGEFTIRRRPASAAQAAREVLEMFSLQAAEKGVTLSFEAGPAMPASLLLDEDRFRQILTNLIGNAVKFTAKGGVGVWLDYDPQSGALFAEVSDTGPGIAPDAQARLFQRFSQVDGSSTRSKGGTGLGLAICQGLAEAMDGSVSVESALGQGSTFRLVLPALHAIGPNLASLVGSASNLGQLEGLRVLVVDDNPVNRELARAILEPVGIEVSEACDGREAVDVATSLPFDAILMDLRMPRMDGAAALAAIRQAPGPNQNMPVLAFSADGMMDLNEAVSRGFQGQVRKPTTPAELLRAVLQAIETFGIVEPGETRHGVA